MSLTRDWEWKIYPLVERIILEAVKYNPFEDDGEFASFVQDEICKLLEAIEECSTFDADKQIHTIVRELTTKKTEVDLRAWSK